MAKANNYPKLHNAMWPGLVGKGAADGEPIIPLDTLLELTANAEVDGQKFDGIDLFIFAPHFDIDSATGRVKRIADQIAGYGLKVGSFVAPIWGGAGGGSAMGSADDRKRFVSQVRKACAIGQQMREIGIRPTGGIRIDSSDRRRGLGQGPEGQHQADRRDVPRGRQDRRRTTASSSSPKARSAGAACIPGARMVNLLEDGRHAGRRRLPGRHGAFDALHARLQSPSRTGSCRRTTTGRTARSSTPPTRRSPMRCGPGRSISTSRRTTARCSAPATTRRPAGTARSPIRTASSISPKHAGYWLRDDKGDLTKTMRHICWDGCMFPNAVMESQQTWNDILGAMIKVRDAHGWRGVDGGNDGKEDTQHRHGRLRLHGPGAFQCLAQGLNFFDTGYQPVLKAVAARNAGEGSRPSPTRGATNRSRATGAS